MSRKPETKFRATIRPLLNALPNTHVEAIQQSSIRGSHDFHLCINGLFVSLELKKDSKEKPSALQTYIADKIKKVAGGISIVASPENWQDVYSYLQHLARSENVQIKVLDCKGSTIHRSAS